MSRIKTITWGPAQWMFACIMGAFVLLALFFPTLLITRKVSFIYMQDYLNDYKAVHLLIQFFYQKGIQLWDFFSQMPHAYFFATFGTFKVANLLTALTYVGTSGFFYDQAKFLHDVFAWVYVPVLLILRACGMVIVLRLLGFGKVFAAAFGLAGALLWAKPAIVIGTFYQSYTPLIMLLILAWVTFQQGRYLLLLALMLAHAFTQGMVHACYLYLGIHGLLLSAVIYQCFLGKKEAWRFSFKEAAIAIVLIGLMLWPYAAMIKLSFADIMFAPGESRLNGFFDLKYYFNAMKIDQVRVGTFVADSLRFDDISGIKYFFGLGFFWCALTGWIMATDRRKWIFAGGLILLWAVNTPRFGFNPGMIGHWINVLTNPMSTMVRSYEMAACAAVGYMLLPLCAWGMIWLWEHDGVKVSAYKMKIWWLLTACLLALAFGINVPVQVRLYTIILSVLIAGALWIKTYTMFKVGRKKYSGWSFRGLLIIMIALDAFLSIVQINRFFAAGEVATPPLAGSARHYGLNLDHQNPRVMGFPYNADMIDTGATSHVWSLRDISPGYSRVINRFIAFEKPGDHFPRHQAYAGWYQNERVMEYVKRYPALAYFVPSDGKNEALIISGERPGDLGGQFVQESLLQSPIVVNSQAHGYWSMSFALSDPFAHIVSNQVSAFPAARVFVETDGQQHELEASQGRLLGSGMFDINNIYQGKMLVSLPRGVLPQAVKVHVWRYQQETGIVGVDSFTHDRLSAAFAAPHNGWAVWHIPYDTKFVITEDGRRVDYTRTTAGFIRWPIKAGRHKVVIDYWPQGWWLRWGLVCSTVVSMGCLVYILNLLWTRLFQYEK